VRAVACESENNQTSKTALRCDEVRGSSHPRAFDSAQPQIVDDFYLAGAQSGGLGLASASGS
jgi:hypothetical protein